MKFYKSLSGDGEIIKWNSDSENLVHWAHELSFVGEGFRLQMRGYKFPYLLNEGKTGDYVWCPVRGKDLYLSFQILANKSVSGKPRRFQVDLDGKVIGEFELAETDEKYYLFCSEDKIPFYGYNRVYLRVIEGDNITVSALAFTTTPVFPPENAVENFTAEDGMIRFTTTKASCCVVEYNEKKYSVGEYLNNHIFDITGFSGGEIKVSAIDREGNETVYETVVESPVEMEKESTHFSHELFYEKKCNEKINVTAFTVFEKGECLNLGDVAICDEADNTYPADVKVTSRWTDGSVKTLSAESVLIPDGRRYFFKSGISKAEEVAEHSIPQWKNHITINGKEIEVNYTPWETAFSGNAKKVLVRDGVLSSPYEKLRICEELTFYNGIDGAVLKTGLENTFTQPRTVDIDSWYVEIYRENREEKYVYQIDDVYADINSEIVKTRSEGFGDDGLYIENFWQNYPKSKEVKKDKTLIGLMPKLGYSEIYSRYDESERHKLLYYMEDGHYRIHMGMRKLFTIGFNFVVPATPILLHPGSERTEKSEAFGKIICANDYTKDFDNSIKNGYDLLVKLREEKREYGMFNYGDWHGESGKNWGNNEYDMPYGGLIQYLRTGDERFADLGYISARHMEEIDCVRVHSDKNLSGLFYLHTPGHSYFYDGIPEDSWEDFNTHVGHLFTEGLTQWYKVTGDERFKDAVLHCADTLSKYYCIDYDFMTEREPAWSMLVMASAYELTGDNKYKNAAKIIKDRVCYRQDKASGAIKRLIDFGDSERKMMFGGKPFMCGILMSAMMRYYEISGDNEAIEITDGLARWLCYEMWDEEQKGFWYTDAQKLRNIHTYPANSMEIIEGLLDSYGRTGDRLLYTRAEAAFLRATNLEYREGDIGKVLAMRLRFAPTALKMLYDGQMKQN